MMWLSPNELRHIGRYIHSVVGNILNHDALHVIMTIIKPAQLAIWPVLLLSFNMLIFEKPPPPFWLTQTGSQYVTGVPCTTGRRHGLKKVCVLWAINCITYSRGYPNCMYAWFILLLCSRGCHSTSTSACDKPDYTILSLRIPTCREEAIS